MATEVHVPTLGESVTEATVGQWFKKVGDAVKADEPLVELETDKVTLEVPAPAAGVLASIAAEDGAVVNVGALLATIDAAAAGASGGKAAAKAPAAPPPAAPAPARPPAPAAAAAPAATAGAAATPVPSPAAAKILTEKGIAPAAVAGTGKDGRITKADAVAASPGALTIAVPAPAAPAVARAPSAPDDAA